MISRLKLAASVLLAIVCLLESNVAAAASVCLLCSSMNLLSRSLNICFSNASDSSASFRLAVKTDTCTSESRRPHRNKQHSRLHHLRCAHLLRFSCSGKLAGQELRVAGSCIELLLQSHDLVLCAGNGVVGGGHVSGVHTGAAGDISIALCQGIFQFHHGNALLKVPFLGGFKLHLGVIEFSDKGSNLVRVLKKRA
jgi:hypothetical protein